jgi:hypothetical protein
MLPLQLLGSFSGRNYIKAYHVFYASSSGLLIRRIENIGANG